MIFHMEVEIDDFVTMQDKSDAVHLALLACMFASHRIATNKSLTTTFKVEGKEGRTYTTD